MTHGSNERKIPALLRTDGLVEQLGTKYAFDDHITLLIIHSKMNVSYIHFHRETTATTKNIRFIGEK